MQCDMCGKESLLYKAKIEGTILNVCSICSKFGKIVAKPKPIVKPEKKIVQTVASQIKKNEAKKEIIETISSDFGTIIRNKRESLGLKQEELAKRLAEKESLIQKIEGGSFSLPISMAKKFESILNIKLIEKIELEEEPINHQNSGGQGFTIGDIIKIRKSDK